MSEINECLYRLTKRCKRDEVDFLLHWFRNISVLFSQHFKDCLAETVKVAPAMLDIAEVYDPIFTKYLLSV